MKNKVVAQFGDDQCFMPYKGTRNAICMIRIPVILLLYIDDKEERFKIFIAINVWEIEKRKLILQKRASDEGVLFYLTSLIY